MKRHHHKITTVLQVLANANEGIIEYRQMQAAVKEFRQPESVDELYLFSVLLTSWESSFQYWQIGLRH